MPNKKYTECTWCGVGWCWKSEKAYYPVCWHCGEAWPGANQARLVQSAGNQPNGWSGRRLVTPGSPAKPVNRALEVLNQLGPSLSEDQQDLLKRKGITLRSAPEPPPGLDSSRLSAADLKSLESAALKLTVPERLALEKIKKA